MLPLVFLGLAIVCALVSRVLLFIGAINISCWWALGVFLPFGPLFFRLNYPEEARKSYIFRLGTLACVLGYVLVGPGLTLGMHKAGPMTPFGSNPSHAIGYAMEKPTTTKQAAPIPSLEERRAANAKEFERLNALAEQLRFRKRDLLHSDTEGNRIYTIDLAFYNDALAKATAEKKALASAK